MDDSLKKQLDCLAAEIGATQQMVLALLSLVSHQEPVLQEKLDNSLRGGDNKRAPLGRGHADCVAGSRRGARRAGWQPASGQDGRAPRRGEVVGLGGETEPVEVDLEG